MRGSVPKKGSIDTPDCRAGRRRFPRAATGAVNRMVPYWRGGRKASCEVVGFWDSVGVGVGNRVAALRRQEGTLVWFSRERSRQSMCGFRVRLKRGPGDTVRPRQRAAVGVGG